MVNTAVRMPAAPISEATDQDGCDFQMRLVGGLDPDIRLLITADALDDLEKARVACENRVRALVDAKGLPDDCPEAEAMRALAGGIGQLEHQATLELQRAMRAHPLGDWVARTVGVGEKQAGRLLAAIGDPAERPHWKMLWAYCGYHVWNDTAHMPADNQTTYGGVAPHRRRGTQANWNPSARMRTYLVAESCIKQRRSPYRVVYDGARAKYADAVHTRDCVRCGPTGSPAPSGSALSDGHKHARALRLVAKQILKDMWTEARATDSRGATA